MRPRITSTHNGQAADPAEHLLAHRRPGVDRAGGIADASGAGAVIRFGTHDASLPLSLVHTANSPIHRYPIVFDACDAERSCK